MKPIHLITAVAGLMFLSTSCMCGYEEGRLYLNTSQRGVIPYQKNEVIGFINNKIETAGNGIDFTVVERTTDWLIADAHESTMCSNIYKIEQDITTLSDSRGEIIIRLYAMMNHSYIDHWLLTWDNTCTLYVVIQLTQTDKWKTFVIPCNQNGDFTIDSISTFLHKTMKLGNVVYNDVLEKRDGKDVLFYNKVYGVLKLVENGKDFLTINH